MEVGERGKDGRVHLDSPTHSLANSSQNTSPEMQAHSPAPLPRAPADAKSEALVSGISWGGGVVVKGSKRQGNG